MNVVFPLSLNICWHDGRLIHDLGEQVIEEVRIDTDGTAITTAMEPKPTGKVINIVDLANSLTQKHEVSDFIQQSKFE